MIHTVHNPLPWGIPWDEAHGVFFGIVYIVVLVLGAGLTYVIAKTVSDLKKGHGSHH